MAGQLLVKRQKTRVDLKHLFLDHSIAAAHIYECVVNRNDSRYSVPQAIVAATASQKGREIKRLVPLKPQIHLLYGKDS